MFSNPPQGVKGQKGRDGETGDEGRSGKPGIRVSTARGVQCSPVTRGMRRAV